MSVSKRPRKTEPKIGELRRVWISWNMQVWVAGKGKEAAYGEGLPSGSPFVVLGEVGELGGWVPIICSFGHRYVDRARLIDDSRVLVSA